ncbi:MAG TPA: class I SAM-dependent methyltransferase, partial [Acidobacteriota bacterium]|nr:class I SAM-dependent methyltransferase [Acidobacteriota bacterium]
LQAAVTETLRVFPNPVCIETGCVRDPNEGTDSTLVIASTLQGRGRFYTFELEPSHIEVCRVVCREFADQINFVQGDAKANLREFAAEHDVIHFAFLDSAPDPDQIFAEFRAVEHRFNPGSVLIVDDAVRGNKGGRIKPYLHTHADWETRLVFAGNGLLVAVKRQS